MTTPDSIIVYRNPLEQAFWEGGYLWPTIVAATVCFVVTLAVLAVLGKFWPYAKWTQPVGLGIGVASTIATVLYMTG